MGIYIGLDIGATKVMVAAASGDGQVLRRSRAQARPGLDEDLAQLDRMVEEAAAGEVILGMGAAVGGPLEWESGVVSPLHAPAWRKVPLKARMEARWGCPFWVDVDTNVAALGEYHYTSMTARRFLYLTISTGMGGGLLLDGRIYRGANGVHPEIAHQSIPYRCSNPAGLDCECGLPDCLEGLISGNAIRRIYGRPAEQLGPAEWAEVAYNLGQGLRNLAAILAPDVIRLGGGVATGAGIDFIRQASRVMQDNLRLVPAPQVELSRLGYDTALFGAISAAIHGFES